MNYKGMSFAKFLLMSRKILVADDDPGIRDIFKIIFERAGYFVEVKEDGRDLLKRNYTQPDIFLMINNYQVLTALIFAGI